MKLASLFSSLLLLVSFSMQSLAFDKMPFDKKTFDQLQKDGVPVLVDVYASWCPTCERQQFALKTYFENNPNSPLKVMVVDYDNQKEWVKHFRAPRQSTLYVYQNNQQLWFSVAETRKRMIHQAIDKALAKPAAK